MNRLLLAVTLALPVAPATAADDPELAGIRQAALDYAESWYEGDPARMERALHPELAKRIVRTGPEGRSRLDQMGALTLINGVKAAHGTKTPAEKRLKDFTLLDRFENTATAKVVMSDWIDYLHLAKWNGRWVIVNVLWEMKPEARK
jgi:hypothetical protein